LTGELALSLLDIRNLSVSYSGTSIWALKNINFQADKGELIIVAGSSGCGKSTLAQTILGLIPTFIEANMKGTILIQETPIEKLTRKQRIEIMGYVPQYPADFTISLLVEEEVAFLLENLAYKPKDIQNRIIKVLKQLGILDLRYRLITELSSGELQRVALSTVLAHQPQILILDEPMARIDPKSEITLVHILKDLAQQGHLILAFEHRLDYLLPVADRLLLLEHGKLIGNGRPESLLERIQNVDLPEVSELKWPGLVQRNLSLKEAQSSLINFIANQ
jgi:energy-coupling factor transporter ATP-binding protein EcfA2